MAPTPAVVRVGRGAWLDNSQRPTEFQVELVSEVAAPTNPLELIPDRSTPE
jgi:hypothetical protein